MLFFPPYQSCLSLSCPVVTRPIRPVACGKWFFRRQQDKKIASI